MTKRKLTKRQSRIAATHQAKRRARLEENLGAEQRGLLISRFGKTVDVECEDGQIHHCHLRQNLLDLVPGDEVVWCDNEQGKGVVVAANPRRSELFRLDSRGNHKPLAANITAMGIMLALQPAPSFELLDRYLVAAELQNIKPFIILNKTDLLDSRRHPLRQHLKVYEKLGYSLIEVSCVKEKGLRVINKTLKDNISVIVGQSGVGKSSLISCLIPEEDIKIGDISTASALGKHTTSTSRLYHLPKGGDLIDSPGVRSFELWRVSTQDVLEGYIEFRPYIGQCQFRNCQHLDEPGCALAHALEEGKITELRLANFQRIIQSLR